MNKKQREQAEGLAADFQAAATELDDACAVLEDATDRNEKDDAIADILTALRELGISGTIATKLADQIESGQ